MIDVKGYDEEEILVLSSLLQLGGRLQGVCGQVGDRDSGGITAFQSHMQSRG